MKTTVETARASLERRIRRFYELLNQGDFERCHEMIDPRIRRKPSSVTLLQYANASGEFLAFVGCCTIIEIGIDLHLGEPSVLYEDRDFATGKTIWQDKAGGQHSFLERWVRDGRTWYTRSSGFVTSSVGQAT